MRRALIVIGLLLVILGLLWPYIAQGTWWRWFGRLPGDIRIERDSGSFHFPITSMLLVSLVLTLLLNLFFRR